MQGVGFRPHVWQLAQRTAVAGSVRNDLNGVTISAFGQAPALDAFVRGLKDGAPRLARIDMIEIEDIASETLPTDFRILQSDGMGSGTGIQPDAATCSDCLCEIADPTDRRFGYAFANCTQCGPRFSIIRHVPYDRDATTMSDFDMCDACREEYENPGDRRFHAQPIACPACGPQLWFEALGQRLDGVDPIVHAAECLKAGQILAIKGLGGFQIAVDACNESAIAELRRKKRRPDKPFALMARDLAQLQEYCTISKEEAALIEMPAAPILLLEAKPGGLAANIAPHQDRLGFMLPNSPLHHLLMARLEHPVVLTSGNISDDPQEIDNTRAVTRLQELVDGFLTHDRTIENRVDDSVLRLDRPGPTVLRRARGLAPASVHCAFVSETAPKVLAMGGELKNTFCLLNGPDAIVSQHIGDLKNATVFADYKATLRQFLSLYDFRPDIVAVDRHPQYLSSGYGRRLADEFGADLVEVQHHHAHLASCLGEHAGAGEPGDEVLAIVLDGTGWGPDKTVWGGEILKGNFSRYERIGGLIPVRLPGGDAAAREPWRNLMAQLHASFGVEMMKEVKPGELRTLLEGKQSAVLEKMLTDGVNSPLTSSAGRFFDAVAAALRICFDSQSFEGQAAMQLECLATPFLAEEEGYEIEIENGTWLSFGTLWRSLLSDLEKQQSPGRIAARVHLGFIDGLARVLENLGGEKDRTVVLSGGVFQNALLLDGLSSRCSERGLHVLTQSKVPPNDGGLALGQALVALAKAQRNKPSR